MADIDWFEVCATIVRADAKLKGYPMETSEDDEMSHKDECICWCESHCVELDDGTFWETDDHGNPVAGPFATIDEIDEYLMDKAVRTDCGRI